MKNNNRLGIFPPRDLRPGDIATIHDSIFFIFQNLKDKNGITHHITALAIQRQTLSTTLNDNHLPLTPKQSSSIGLPKGQKFYVDLTISIFPTEQISLPDYVAVTAQTANEIGIQKALYINIVRAANNHMEREEIPHLFEQPDPAQIKIDTVITPGWLKKKRSNGKTTTVDISIDDAHEKGYLDTLTYQLLKQGTFHGGKKVKSLNDAFKMASDPSEQAKHDFSQLLESGLTHTNATLEQGFDYGYIDEDEACKAFNSKSRGFTTIIAAQRAIREDHPSLKRMNETYMEHVEENPLKAFKRYVRQAHADFLQAYIK